MTYSKKGKMLIDHLIPYKSKGEIIKHWYYVGKIT